jgi:hypothetical protein
VPPVAGPSHGTDGAPLVAALAVAQCLALLCVSQCALAAAKSAHMVFAALRRCLLISASRSQLTMGPKVSQSLFQCEVIVMLIALWASDSRNQLDKNTNDERSL